MSTFSDRGKAAPSTRIDILPPDDGHDKVVHLRRRAPDVVDAAFEPVRDGLPITRQARSENDNRVSLVTTPRQAERMPALVLHAERRLMRLSPDLFLALVAAVFAAVFSFSGGLSLISGETIVPHDGPALDITHVTMTPQDADGMRILLINGIIENRTADLMAMPAIRAELLSGGTVLTSTLIKTASSQIGGRQSYGFSARVPHPGGKLPDLRLSLAQRGA